MNDTDLMDLALTAGRLADNQRDYALHQANDNGWMVSMAAQYVEVDDEKPGRLYPLWTAEEDEFLKDNTGFLSLEEIAETLGRPLEGVKLRRQRTGIPATTKRWMSANDVADRLGVDCKVVVRWIDEMGFLDGWLLPVKHTQYAITELALKRFIIKPEHWTLLNVHAIPDPHLRRLALRAMERWGDRWVTTGQVAEWLGCHHKDVLLQIYRGRIRGVQLRNPGAAWHVRESDARKLVIPRGKGTNGLTWNDEADAFRVLAAAVGIPKVSIGILTGEGRSSEYRLRYLIVHDMVDEVLERVGIGNVQFNREARLLFADWRPHRHRFPYLARSVEKFLDGRKLPRRGMHEVMGVLNTWNQRHFPAGFVKGASHKTTQATMYKKYLEMVNLGVDPLRDIKHIGEEQNNE
jgi:hypothetical protein